MTPRVAVAMISAVAAGLSLFGGAAAQAAIPAGGPADQHSAEQALFPRTFSLPDGWQPEGIAVGPGPFAYSGSLADGSIFRADLRTGEGRVISEGPGTMSVGLRSDRRGRLFVAGGGAGNARVIDAGSGQVSAQYQLVSGTTDVFINDVVITRGAAWFTNSSEAALYKLRLGPGGALPAEAERLPLTGDLVVVPGQFNANGIVQTPDGRGLLIDQTVTGQLFRVDPNTGVTKQVDLGGQTLANADGMLLQGRTLYVVQNALNTVTVLRMNSSGTAARPIRRITDPSFDTPTAVAAFGNRLYLPNARFNTTPEPTTPYNVVSVPVG